MGYFDLQPWESGGRLYQTMGIRFFRGLAIGGNFWKRLYIRVCRKKPTPRWYKKNYVRYVKYWTPLEIAHLTSLVILLVATVYLSLRSDLYGALLLIALNLIVNLIPVLIIRYNRGRILIRVGQKVFEVLLEQ